MGRGGKNENLFNFVFRGEGGRKKKNHHSKNVSSVSKLSELTPRLCMTRRINHRGADTGFRSCVFELHGSKVPHSK